MLTISNEADYALLLISELKKNQEFVSLSHLIEKTHLPQRFIAKIGSKLAKAKVLQSKEGKVGGYKLAADWNKVNLVDFLSIFDKKVTFVKCNDKEYRCVFEDICNHKHSLSHTVSAILNKTLASWTLEDVLSGKKV